MYSIMHVAVVMRIKRENGSNTRGNLGESERLGQLITKFASDWVLTLIQCIPTPDHGGELEKCFRPDVCDEERRRICEELVMIRIDVEIRDCQHPRRNP